jgi:hypothetical protein
MKARLGRLIALVAASAAMALAMSAPAASAAETCSNITGSGSSLQNVLQKEVWIPGFEAQSPHVPVACTAAPTVTYVSTSSGKGLNCWGASTEKLEVTGALKECGTEGVLDAYIDTDVAPEGPAQNSTKQLFKMAAAGKQKGAEPNQVVAVPVAQSAITVMVSLPAGCEPAQQGEKARWNYNDLEQAWYSGQTKLSQLKFALGAGCQAVQTKEAILFARSSASGTTAGFKRFLDQVKHSDWGSFVETAEKAESTTWPSSNVQVANPKGKEEAEKVFNTPNSVGYADLADARAAGFKLFPVRHEQGQQKYYSFFVEVQNKEGQAQKTKPTYASPEIEEGGEQLEGANCLEAKYENQSQLKVGQDQDWSKARQVKELEGEAGGPYPICTLTFDVAWEHYGFFNEGAQPSYNTQAGTANSVLDYLTYIVKLGQEATKLDSLHYAKLPTEIRTAAEAGVKKTNIGL